MTSEEFNVYSTMIKQGISSLSHRLASDLYKYTTYIYTSPCGKVRVLSDATPREILTLALNWSDSNNG